MADLVLGLLAGVLVGALYFGGMWITARRLLRARNPAILVLGSYLARLAVLGAAFYWIARSGGATAAIAALLGVVGARQLIVARAAPREARAAASTQE